MARLRRRTGGNLKDGAVRRPILSVSETAQAGKSWWFGLEYACYFPVWCPEQKAIRKIVADAKNKIPLDKVNRVYQMEAWVENADGIFFTR